MKIINEPIEHLNEALKVSIFQEDYKDAVERKLQNHKKNAQMHGFRKGQVPMALVRKQYEKSFVFDEVQKILQQTVQEYIEKEKFDLIGGVIPKKGQDINWEEKDFLFEFEFGITPSFEIDLNKIKAIYYNISVSEKEIEDYIKSVREKLGQLENKEEVSLHDQVYGSIKEVREDKKDSEALEEKPWEGSHKLYMEKLSAQTRSKFLKAVIGDQIQTTTKELFKTEKDWNEFIKDKRGHFSINFTIENIFEVKPAELNQDFFNKIYQEGSIKDEKEFYKKTKEKIRENYAKEVDKFFLDKVVSQLIKLTNFDLPKSFLERWISFENPNLKEDQIKEGYQRDEAFLRRQLIESKILKDFKVEISEEEVRENMREFVRLVWNQGYQASASEGQVEEIVSTMIKDKKQFQRASSEVMGKKLVSIFKEKIHLENKPISWEGFRELNSNEKELAN